MDKESLFQILREFLTVEVSHQEETWYDSAEMKVKLLLDGEVVSESITPIYKSNARD